MAIWLVNIQIASMQVGTYLCEPQFDQHGRPHVSTGPNSCFVVGNFNHHWPLSTSTINNHQRPSTIIRHQQTSPTIAKHQPTTANHGYEPMNH